MALIAVGVSILIGFFVISDIQTSVASNSLTSAQADQLSSVANSLSASFGLGTVLPVVLLAALIIGAFFAFMGAESIYSRA